MNFTKALPASSAVKSVESPQVLTAKDAEERWITIDNLRNFGQRRKTGEVTRLQSRPLRIRPSCCEPISLSV